MHQLSDRRFRSPVVMLSACLMTVLVSGAADAQSSARLAKRPVVKTKQSLIARVAAPAVSVEPADILVTVVNSNGEPVSEEQASAFLRGTPNVAIIRHPRADTRGVNKDYSLKRGTEALGINDHGNVVGDYVDTSGVTRAYVLESVNQPGNLYDIEIAGASFTRAYAINNNGLIVGTFRGADGVHKGFRVTLEEARQAANRPIELSDANTIDMGGINTQALGVNDLGTVVGGYAEPSGVVYAFRQDAGKPPEKIPFENGSFNSAFDITNDGVILGNYGEVNAQTGYYLRSRTFLLSADGRQIGDYDVGFPVTNSAIGINENLEMIGMSGAGSTCQANVSFFQVIGNPEFARAGDTAEVTPMRAFLRMENRVSTALSKINRAGAFVGTTDSPEGALVGLVGSIR